MKRKLNGQVALVTGGAVRLGRAVVERLAARRSVREARALARSLNRDQRVAAVVTGALTSQAACERIIREARKAFGRLDILVNSAAVFTKQPLGAITAASLQAEFWPNLFAPILLTQAFARPSRRGQVIHLLDRRIAGHDTACVPYLLTKKALADFTAVAALALAPRIRVNAVAPGPVLPPPGQGARYLRDHAGRLPLGRPPTPAAVAEAVVALLHSPSTTGQVLFVDGGQHLLGNGV